MDDILEKLRQNQILKEEELKKFLEGIKWQSSRSAHGGQHHNGPDPGVVLTHENYGVRIEVSQKRTQAENRRIALHMFYFFLDHLESLNQIKDGADTTTASPQDVPGSPES